MKYYKITGLNYGREIEPFYVVGIEARNRALDIPHLDNTNRSWEEVSTEEQNKCAWIAIGQTEVDKITTIVRWGKNGHKYMWRNPTQKQMDKLIKKYEIDQICDNTLWLQW